MYVCVRVCSHMRLFLPYVFYTVWCLSKSCAHANGCKNKITCCEKKKKKEKRKIQLQRVGTSGGVRGFDAGLQAGGRFAFGGSCDRPTLLGFSVVFLGPGADAGLVPGFRVALHASHAALPVVALEVLHCTDVTS
jgi:hypothetical protein